MKIINPKTIEDWDRLIIDLDKLFTGLPDIPEFTFDREANDIEYLESQIILLDSVDREYTEVAIFANSLRAIMAYWKDLKEAKFRDATLEHIDDYPSAKDRDAKIKVLSENWSKRLRAARMYKDTIEAKKRRLQRQIKSLTETINMEKKLRY